jgi:chemotaxis protein CheD
MYLKKTYYVTIGNAVFGQSPDIISCKGLGSCVAVCLYDEVIKKGCVVHILLPFGNDEKRPFFYANLGIANALERCVKFGMKKDRIWAKIVGGACVFSHVDEKSSIGAKNIIEARKWLNFFKVPILSEDTGGRSGRNLAFDLETGQIEVFTLKKGKIII